MPDTALALAQKAAQHLSDKGIENARLDAELMLADILGINRLQLYLQFDRPVLPEELDRFRSSVRRRLKHEPLQYITGTAAFRKLELKVDRRALIPRPETEILAGEVIRFVAQRAGAAVLDLGTGSGAIALSIAAETGCRVVATDVSPDALDLARTNAVRVDVIVEFRAGDLWEAIEPGERFDAIVSNPPYVGTSERDGLPPEVREWEPVTALFADGDGLSVIRRVVAGALEHLGDGGLLAMEIGYNQAESVLELLRASGFTDPRIVKDLAGRDRVALANA